MNQKTATEMATDILIAGLQSGQVKVLTDNHSTTATRIGEAYRIILNSIRYAERDPIRSPGDAA